MQRTFSSSSDCGTGGDSNFDSVTVLFAFSGTACEFNVASIPIDFGIMDFKPSFPENDRYLS